jgi:hypothetical protein
MALEPPPPPRPSRRLLSQNPVWLTLSSPPEQFNDKTVRVVESKGIRSATFRIAEQFPHEREPGAPPKFALAIWGSSPHEPVEMQALPAGERIAIVEAIPWESWLTLDAVARIKPSHDPKFDFVVDFRE